MISKSFKTDTGTIIPSVDESQMREVDRIAVEDFGLGILQMMENAGRNLALTAINMLDDPLISNVTIFAGTGGNGGGGLCCARHLLNKGVQVNIVTTKFPADIIGPAKNQLDIVLKMGINAIGPINKNSLLLEKSNLVIDALIGYGLNGPPKGKSAKLIEIINLSGKPVLSLDIPSGINANTGETPGAYVKADSTLTLALPKIGLKNPNVGKIILGQIGIPIDVYKILNIPVDSLLNEKYLVNLIYD